jgi:beta-lactamase class A
VSKPVIPSIDRRRFLAGALALGAGCASTARGAPADRAPDARRSGSLAKLERAHGGRLGVAALDLASGRRVEHRADERFPFCSTFKTLAVATTLRRVDLGQEQLARSIGYTQADLLDHAPVAKAHLARGTMTIAEMCEAAITVSDNTAANLLIREAGGLGAINACARSIGDSVTRLDRVEPELNSAIAGDPRDTTSPRAMIGDLQRLILGDALSAASREQITTWHLATQTGAARLRAGLPADWRLAHKTGTGSHGATNDIGIAWPPVGAPLLIAVYYVDGPADSDAREAVIASAARVVSAG